MGKTILTAIIVAVLDALSRLSRRLGNEMK